VATITSSNAGLLELTTDSTGANPTPSLTVNVPGGSSSVTFFAVGLASSGTATVTMTIPGYQTSTSVEALTPSGFVLCAYSPQTYVYGPGFLPGSCSGDSIATTSFSPPTTFYLYLAQLDPTSLNAASLEPMAAGAAPVTVSLSNGVAGAGMLGASSVVVNPANNQYFYYYSTFLGYSDGSTTFAPSNPGAGNISISSAPPAGYATPANLQTLPVTVTAPTTPTAAVTSVTVGKNLMTTSQGELSAAAPAGGLQVTVSAADPTQVLLSATGTDAGSASLTFTFSQGQYQTPQFWVYSVGGLGSQTINISAPGYTSGSGIVTIDPSGFVFQSASNFTTGLLDTPTTLYIAPSALDPMYLTQVAIQQLRPGLTNTQVTVTVTDEPSHSGPSTVGQITANPVVFNGADNPNQQVTSFQPIGVGQTLLQLTSPGFSASSSEITVVVVAGAVKKQ
jgi:hypothetical protein